MQGKQIRQRVVQGFQPGGNGIGAVRGDHPIGDVTQPVAVALDDAPAGEAQSGSMPSNLIIRKSRSTARSRMVTGVRPGAPCYPASGISGAGPRASSLTAASRHL